MSEGPNILVIRYSSIGDILLTTPVLRILKQKFKAHVTVILKKKYVELLKYNPNVDIILVKEESSLHTLREARYDYVIDLQKNLRSVIQCWLIGKRSLTYSKLTYQKWLYMLFKIDKLRNSHVVDRYIQAIEPLGLKSDGGGMDFYYAPKMEADRPKSALRPNRKKRIVIALGGSYVTKRIPFKYLPEITSNGSYEYILLGGADVIIDNNILEQLSVVNLIGQTSLRESGDMISNSNLVITGDTGVLHMAAALQKPIIVIWGSTSPKMGFGPYYGVQSDVQHISVYNEDLTCRPCSKYGRKKCPKGHMNCLNKLNVNQIQQEIKRMIG